MGISVYVGSREFAWSTEDGFQIVKTSKVRLLGVLIAKRK